MQDNVVLPGAGVDPRALTAKLANEHVADIVEILNRQPPAVASEILDLLPFERAVDVLDQPGLAGAADLIASLPDERAATLVAGMSPNRLAEVFRELDEPRRSELADRLDHEARLTLQRLLAFPRDTAGGIMTTEFIGVPSTWTVGQTLDHIRRIKRTRETVYAVYVLDPRTKKLVQSVSLRRLIGGQPDAPVLSVAHSRVFRRSPTAKTSRASSRNTIFWRFRSSSEGV
jgi:magnesium transporter